jgi:hypothetical protein
MKFISLVLLCGVAYLNAAPTTPDYREMFDHLMMEMVNERLRSAEQFLSHLSHQVLEFQTTKNEEVRKHIVQELEFVLPMVKAAEERIAVEMKKTGLDLIEKYEIQKVKAIADVALKVLTEVQTIVGKAPSFFAATAAPKVDYRNEYDRLLFQTIQEHIQRADGALLMLNRQLDQYLKTKSVEIKDRIIREVDLFVPMLKGAEEHAQRELKRTDLDVLERFLYEKAADEVALLIKHYTQIETQVKTGKPVTTFFAATVAPQEDFRSDYDRLLFQMVEENVRRGDYFLVELMRQFNAYQTSKDAALKARIINEVDFTAPMIKRGIEMAETQLKRTDLNHVERYMYEKIRDEAMILQKHFTALEAQLKKP